MSAAAPAVRASPPPSRPPSIGATLFPTLWPTMLWRRRALPGWPFPLDHPQARFVYLARYGIYQAATALSLGGREVLFPAFFHCVELDALLAAGVRPRFFPVGDGLQVDVDAIADRIGPSTAAVYLIHYGGFPGPVEAVATLCRERGIALIEDCAHALLSLAGERPLGSFGDAAVFSLPKVLPVPNGGVVLLRGGLGHQNRTGRRPPLRAVGPRTVSSVLQNLEMRGIAGSAAVRRVALGLGKAAFARAGVDHMPTGTPEFEPSYAEFGMSPASWRVLRGQDFATIAAARRRNYRRLHDRLGDMLPPIVAALPLGVSPLFYPFRVERRDALLARLAAYGVKAGEFWPEWHPAVPRDEFPEVDRLRRTALWLPCHQDLTIASVDRLADAVRRAALELNR